MITVRESLLSVSAYPVPMRTIEAISLKRGVALDAVADEDYLASLSYKLATADLYKWLYFAPNVGQGGQTYSFTADQREMWRKTAVALYKELGEENELEGLKGHYGYMGSRL